MIITWLEGKVRIKGPKFTQEISGYRCSHCNHFETAQRRTCPNCKGEYKGKVHPNRKGVSVIDKEDEDE